MFTFHSSRSWAFDEDNFKSSLTITKMMIVTANVESADTMIQVKCLCFWVEFSRAQIILFRMSLMKRR